MGFRLRGPPRPVIVTIGMVRIVLRSLLYHCDRVGGGPPKFPTAYLNRAEGLRVQETILYVGLRA